MAEPISPRTLRELVSSFEKKGVPSLGGFYGRASLVQCDRESGGGAWGFETRAVTVSWDAQVALALVRGAYNVNPELLSKAGAVYPVVKRAGGPFPDRVGVGRTRAADIFLPHASVSKYHAYFVRDDASGSWTLWDARSRNGTTLGDRRLSSGEGAPLANGATVLFGESMFLFFDEAGSLKLIEGLAQSKPGAMRM
jgi:hypothetical protein